MARRSPCPRLRKEFDRLHDEWEEAQEDGAFWSTIDAIEQKLGYVYNKMLRSGCWGNATLRSGDVFFVVYESRSGGHTYYGVEVYLDDEVDAHAKLRDMPPSDSMVEFVSCVLDDIAGASVYGGTAAAEHIEQRMEFRKTKSGELRPVVRRVGD